MSRGPNQLERCRQPTHIKLPVQAASPNFSSSRPMRVVLVSPKGPLYRHRGGIWKKSLRYQPLTLTTLAALIPAELLVDLQLFDEGITDVPLDLDVDLVALTVITGTAVRAYELADHFR